MLLQPVVFDIEGQLQVKFGIDTFLNNLDSYEAKYIENFRKQMEQFRKLQKWLQGGTENIEFSKIAISEHAFKELLSYNKVCVGFLDMQVIVSHTVDINDLNKLEIILNKVEDIDINMLKELLSRVYKNNRYNSVIQKFTNLYIKQIEALEFAIELIHSNLPHNINLLEISELVNVKHILRYNITSLHNKESRNFATKFADILATEGVNVANEYLSKLKSQKEKLIDRYCIMFTHKIDNQSDDQLIKLQFKLHLAKEVVKRMGYLFMREKSLINGNKQSLYLEMYKKEKFNIDETVSLYFEVVTNQLNKYLINDLTQIITQYL